MVDVVDMVLLPDRCGYVRWKQSYLRSLSGEPIEEVTLDCDGITQGPTPLMFQGTGQ